MIAFCLMLGPQTVTAQSLSVPDGAVRECFAQTPSDAAYPDCLGQAANQCQDQPGGSTTIAIAECIGAETDVWDAILNEEYGRTRQSMAQSGGEDLTLTLRDAQRAWIAFRDADCALHYERWAGGTIRSIVYANCMLKMTASRAIALRDMAEGNP